MTSGSKIAIAISAELGIRSSPARTAPSGKTRRNKLPLDPESEPPSDEKPRFNEASRRVSGKPVNHSLSRSPHAPNVSLRSKPFRSAASVSVSSNS